MSEDTTADTQQAQAPDDLTQVADRLWDQTGVLNYPTTPPGNQFGGMQTAYSQYEPANDAPTTPVDDDRRPASSWLVGLLVAVGVGAAGLAAFVALPEMMRAPSPTPTASPTTVVVSPPPPVTTTVTPTPTAEAPPVAHPDADSLYLGLLRDAGWVVADQPQVIRVAHAECLMMRNGQTALHVIDQVAAKYLVTWKAANSQVSSAQVAYCPDTITTTTPGTPT
jgi:Protein of unknown function (DUF732)